MPAWRLVTEQIATLEEVERYYSIDDIADACDMLDKMALDIYLRSPS